MFALKGKNWLTNAASCANCDPLAYIDRLNSIKLCARAGRLTRQLSSGYGSSPLSVEESVVALSVCIKWYTAFTTFHATQLWWPEPALSFVVMLSRFTNSDVKPGVANMRSAFEMSPIGINCHRKPWTLLRWKYSRCDRVHDGIPCSLKFLSNPSSDILPRPCSTLPYHILFFTFVMALVVLSSSCSYGIWFEMYFNDKYVWKVGSITRVKGSAVFEWKFWQQLHRGFIGRTKICSWIHSRSSSGARPDAVLLAKYKK